MTTYNQKIAARLRLGFDRFMRRRLPPCKEIVKIITASFDRELTLRERFVMRMHVFVCRPCTRFFEQSEFLNRATRDLDNKLKTDVFDGQLSSDARSRIKAALNNAVISQSSPPQE